MQQRYYDPTVGRFLSVDPVTALSSPVGMFNRYKYAANNPYRFVDPDGRMAIQVGPHPWNDLKGDGRFGDPACRSDPQCRYALHNGRSNNDGKSTHARSRPQDVANKVAQEVTSRGRFSPGMAGKREADTIYQNNSNPTLTVRVNSGDLTVAKDEAWRLGSSGKQIAGGTVQGADFFVHGHVVIAARANGTYGIFDQPYHYGMWSGSDGDSMVRNLLTKVGTPEEGAGNTPFMIEYRGNAQCSNCQE